MVRMGGTQSAAIGLLFFTLMAGQTQAELYRFTGVLPTSSDFANEFILDTVGTDMEGRVNPGDSWTVVADVDTGTELSNGSTSTLGWYAMAIRYAEISFSSGYSIILTPDYLFDIGDVFVQNDSTFAPPYESVSAEMYVDAAYLRVAVSTETQLGTLDGVKLPLGGVGFVQDLSLSGDRDTVLWFESPYGGLVSYKSGSGEAFQVVPEPSTMTLWCVAALGLCGVWWRKRYSQ